MCIKKLLSSIFSTSVPNNKIILIVEPADRELKSIISAITKAGYSVLHAKSGMTALILSKKHNPDLIIVNIQLPDMSGIDFCKKIKEDVQTRHISVLLLSDLQTPSKILESYEYGADNVLMKPISPKSLLLYIDQIFKEIPVEH